MNGKAGLLDFRQCQIVFCSLLFPHLHPGIGSFAADAKNLDFHMPADSRKSRTLHGCPPSNESLPIPDRLERPFQSRRRHFQHVATGHQVRGCIEARLDCPRRHLTIPNLDTSSVQPVDPHVEDRAPSRPPDPEIDKLVSKRRNFLRYNIL
jgi:hypothetical protein